MNPSQNPNLPPWLRSTQSPIPPSGRGSSLGQRQLSAPPSAGLAALDLSPSPSPNNALTTRSSLYTSFIVPPSATPPSHIARFSPLNSDFVEPQGPTIPWGPSQSPVYLSQLLQSNVDLAPDMAALFIQEIYSCITRQQASIGEIVLKLDEFKSSNRPTWAHLPLLQDPLRAMPQATRKQLEAALINAKAAKKRREVGKRQLIQGGHNDPRPWCSEEFFDYCVCPYIDTTKTTCIDTLNRFRTSNLDISPHDVIKKSLRHMVARVCGRDGAGRLNALQITNRDLQTVFGAPEEEYKILPKERFMIEQMHGLKEDRLTGLWWKGGISLPECIGAIRDGGRSTMATGRITELPSTPKVGTREDPGSPEASMGKGPASLFNTQQSGPSSQKSSTPRSPLSTTQSVTTPPGWKADTPPARGDSRQSTPTFQRQPARHTPLPSQAIPSIETRLTSNSASSSSETDNDPFLTRRPINRGQLKRPITQLSKRPPDSRPSNFSPPSSTPEAGRSSAEPPTKLRKKEKPGPLITNEAGWENKMLDFCGGKLSGMTLTPRRRRVFQPRAIPVANAERLERSLWDFAQHDERDECEGTWTEIPRNMRTELMTAVMKQCPSSPVEGVARAMKKIGEETAKRDGNPGPWLHILRGFQMATAVFMQQTNAAGYIRGVLADFRKVFGDDNLAKVGFEKDQETTITYRDLATYYTDEHESGWLTDLAIEAALYAVIEEIRLQKRLSQNDMPWVVNSQQWKKYEDSNQTWCPTTPKGRDIYIVAHSGVHWHLIIIKRVQAAKGLVYVADSMRDTRREERSLSLARNFAKTKGILQLDKVRTDAYQQQDGSNCGIHVLENAVRFLEYGDFNCSAVGLRDRALWVSRLYNAVADVQQRLMSSSGSTRVQAAGQDITTTSTATSAVAQTETSTPSRLTRSARGKVTDSSPQAKFTPPQLPAAPPRRSQRIREKK